MIKEQTMLKRSSMAFSRWLPILIFLFSFLSVLAPLFAASITNEGDTIVKVSARSNKGISGGGAIQPGQSLNLRNNIAWVEHVPEGGSTQVHLRIIENDGTVGYISTSGGRYTFRAVKESDPAAQPEKKKSNLATGYADNRSNVAMSLNIVNRSGAQNFVVLRPAQRTVIPEDTVEVRVDQHGWVSGDAQISLSVFMPDGKERVVRTSHAVVRLDSPPK